MKLFLREALVGRSVVLDLLSYLTGVGKSTDFELRENRVPVHNDVKNSVFTRNQLCLHIKFFTQFFRQTGGSGLIVSHATVMDFNFHNMPPA